MQIAADMRWVRQQSIYGKAGIVKILVLKEENTYLIQDGNKVLVERVLPPGLKFKEIILDGKMISFSLTGAPARAGRIVLENSFGEQRYIYFMPSSGRIRVADQPGDEDG